MILRLLQIILLSWSLIARTEAQALTKRNCPSKCGNVTIPFPFGIKGGCYIDDWFAIDCENSVKPLLRKLHLEVLEISLHGTMRVNHLVFKSCLGDYNTTIYGNLLAESPFVFSQRSNRFTGMGCNNIAYMSINNSDSSVAGGCLSICDNKSTTVEENGCYGIKCCQTRIPSFLKVINATVSIINYENRTKQGCKYAFLVEQTWFETNLRNPQGVQKMTHVPVVLDWRILNSSFNSFATEKPTTYKLTSSCEAADNWGTRFSVVQCHCNQAYEGNPYLLQGCQDIDECNSNICGKMKCKNLEGGYACFSTKKPKTNSAALGFGTGLGSFFLILGAWWLWTIIKKRKAIKLKQKFFKQNGGLLLQDRLTLSDGSVDRSKLFDSKELEKATDHFNVNRILGRGGQGTVYKGMLPDGRIVAVKKFKVGDEGDVYGFINEVVILSQINHRNVVKLYGCCLETEVPLLVYEFIPSGTLFQYLHHPNEELFLTWGMRLRIATEVAGALSYLHSATSLPIYHRDIKSTNILLDEKYRAKVADFGTSRLIAIDQTHVTTKVQGTFGYLDPEYFQSSQFTDKSDVYSFGVVLVELLTGHKPISSTISQENRSLVASFIISMEEKSLFDILDAQVVKQGKREDIMAIANLAKRCLNLKGKKRPTMKEVATELEGIQASQKENRVPQSYTGIEYERSQVFEGFDAVSSFTSTSENAGPSVDVQLPR